MDAGGQAAKLAEIRDRTDRELILLAERNLNRGLRLVRLAQQSMPSRPACEDLRTRSERAYAEAVVLLSYVYHMAEETRQSLELKQAQLRTVLDELALPCADAPTPRKHVSAVARILWEARGCPNGTPDTDWFRAEQLMARAPR